MGGHRPDSLAYRHQIAGFTLIEILVALGAVAVVVVVVVVALSSNPGSPTAGGSTLRIQHDQQEPAAPRGKVVCIQVQSTSAGGAGVPARNVTFTITDGATTGITSNIAGSNTARVATNIDGVAQVTITGTGDGADNLQIEVGLAMENVPYETASTNPPGMAFACSLP